MRLTLCVCGDQQAVILGTVTDGIRRHDVTHARFDYSCKGNRPSSVSHTAERGWGHTSAMTTRALVKGKSLVKGLVRVSASENQMWPASPTPHSLPHSLLLPIDLV